MNINVPDYWTAKEAKTVFEFIDELKEKILEHYGEQIVTLAREEHYQAMEDDSDVEGFDDSIEF